MDMITYNSYPWIMFSEFWLSFGGGGGGGIRLKLDVWGQGGGRALGVDGQGGWGVLKISICKSLEIQNFQNCLHSGKFPSNGRGQMLFLYLKKMKNSV